MLWNGEVSAYPNKFIQKRAIRFGKFKIPEQRWKITYQKDDEIRNDQRRRKGGEYWDDSKKLECGIAGHHENDARKNGGGSEEINGCEWKYLSLVLQKESPQIWSSYAEKLKHKTW